MLKYLQEKLHNKAFWKRSVSVIVAVLVIAGYSLYTRIMGGSLRSGMFAVVAYLLALGTIYLVWYLVERKIFGANTGEIDPLLGNITLDILPKLYMPIIISDMSGKIIWFNKAFCTMSGTKNGYYGKNIDQVCRNSLDDIINAQENDEGLDTVAFDRFYRVKAYTMRTANNKSFCVTVWNSRDELNEAYNLLKEENTLVAYIMIDNLDELLQHIQEKYSDFGLPLRDSI